MFTGWAPSTNTTQEYQGLEQAKERLASIQETHSTLTAQLRAKQGLEVAKTKEVVERATSLAPQPLFTLSLKSFLLNFTKAFDELELARERFLLAFELYRKSMENGLASYSDFYKHEYADISDIARSASRAKTQPSLAADWVLLERERESEQYYQAKEKLVEAKRVFEAVFTKELEELLGGVAQTLETSRFTQNRQAQKLLQLQEMLTEVLKASGLTLEAEEQNPNPTQSVPTPQPQEAT